MMKSSQLFAVISAALISLSPMSAMRAMAESATGADTSAEANGPKPADCTQAHNSQACAARQQARLACKDKKGAAFRQCVVDALPAPDCSKVRNPQRCDADQKARVACIGKVGREHKQCLVEAKAEKK